MLSSPGRSETREEESADPEPPEVLREEIDLAECDRAVLEERVVALEETLAQEERRRNEVIERYERILDRRGRERGADGGTLERTTPESGGSHVAAVREFVGGVVSRLR